MLIKENKSLNLFLCSRKIQIQLGQPNPSRRDWVNINPFFHFFLVKGCTQIKPKILKNNKNVNKGTNLFCTHYVTARCLVCYLHYYIYFHITWDRVLSQISSWGWGNRSLDTLSTSVKKSRNYKSMSSHFKTQTHSRCLIPLKKWIVTSIY